MAKYIKKSNLTVANTRGNYGELIGPGTGAIISFVSPSLPETFADFDSKGRGDAINLDLYGWDADQSVAVIQVRHAFRQHKKWFMQVRKTYVLCGFNENGEAFRHPVSASVIHGAIRRGCTPEQVVEAVQCWMWKVKPDVLALSRRQGDVLIVPERSANPLKNKEYKVLGNSVTVAGTHEIDADEIVRIDGKPFIYAKNPILRHKKGQHKDTKAPMSDSKWFTIRVADEEASWNFSQRLGD
ncbi:hypothetical protein [Gluconobacter cerinus]|uniref:hypothetical protein n=1 Tax=Gluconobacter cerinus TaxID=38307 RepID=UPI001B8CD922|nr:hypothetical protein [Gluconobacter cerinus]MBS1038081.1 hypothetical protein [Gluconobacter cerinus]